MPSRIGPDGKRVFWTEPDQWVPYPWEEELDRMEDAAVEKPEVGTVQPTPASRKSLRAPL